MLPDITTSIATESQCWLPSVTMSLTNPSGAKKQKIAPSSISRGQRDRER